MGVCSSMLHQQGWQTKSSTQRMPRQCIAISLQVNFPVCGVVARVKRMLLQVWWCRACCLAAEVGFGAMLCNSSKCGSLHQP